MEINRRHYFQRNLSIIAVKATNKQINKKALKGLVVGNPFKLITILAVIQNYRFPLAMKGEKILLNSFLLGFPS